MSHLVSGYGRVRTETYGRGHDAFIIGVVVGGQLRDFAVVPRDVVTDGPGEVLRLDGHGVDVEFHALVLHLAHVGGNLVGEVRAGGGADCVQQVFRLLHIELQATVDAVVQETVVHSHVVRVRLFPLQVGAVAVGFQQVRTVVLRIVVRAEYILGQVHVVAYVLLAGDTVTETEFQVGKYATGVIHELLVDDAPSHGYGGEHTPAVVLAEAGGTVPTEGSCQQVAVHQVVVQTSEEGHQVVLPRVALAVVAEVAAFAFVPRPACGGGSGTGGDV